MEIISEKKKNSDVFFMEKVGKSSLVSDEMLTEIKSILSDLRI